MSTIQNYKDLRIWQQSMKMTKQVYQLMQHMPKEEMFGLTNQLKRAAVSVPSNIAEGQARGTKEFIHFLTIAKGSLAEVETQILLTVELEMLQPPQIQALLLEIESLTKQINSLLKTLRQKT